MSGERGTVSPVSPRPAVNTPGTALIVTVAILAHLFIRWITDASFAADTQDYAIDVTTLAQRWDPARAFEFGHLLWRPLATLATHVVHVVSAGPIDQAYVTSVLNWLVWPFGILGTVAVARIAIRHAGHLRGIILTLALILTSEAFVNFSQTGTSYLPALALSLVALDLLDVAYAIPVSTRRCMAGGVVLALAVGLWFPFVLTVPGVLLAPLVVNRASWKGLRIAFITCAATGAVMFLSLAVLQGIHDVAGFRAWMQGSGHGLAGVSGLPRMVVGFARSLIQVGDVGIDMKRLMLHDPFAQVTTRSVLLSLGALGMIAVYAVVGLLFLRSLTRDTWRGLAAAMLFAVPTVVFAYFWFGGDMERFMPFLPGLLLMTAVVLGRERTFGVASLGVTALLLIMAFSNWTVLGVPPQRAQQERMVGRLTRVTSPPDRTTLVAANWTDELQNLQRSYPDHPLVRAGISVTSLVTIGEPDVDQFASQFARRARVASNAGRQIWLSTRCLADRPDPAWRWVEGDDPRGTWRDIVTFCRKLSGVAEYPGFDGFVPIDVAKIDATPASTGSPIPRIP